MGDKLRISGWSSWSGTLRLWYIPVQAKLVNDTDIFNGISGYEDYVINYSIIKAKIRDDKAQASDLFQIKKDLEKKIRESAADTDFGEPDQVRDMNWNGLDDDLFRGLI
ncbi:MAG: hypothetical protein ACYTFK_13200 [Planctomycetota bacterium]|jgi:hypothetical protein